MPPPDRLDKIAARTKEAACAIVGSQTEAAKRLRDLIAGIRLDREQVSILLNPGALERLLDIRVTNDAIRIDIAGQLKRSGRVMRLIQRNGSSAEPIADRSLIKAFIQGRSWWRELQANTNMTVGDLARREGKTAAYIVRIVRLAFLSPTVLKSIRDGTLPAHLTVKRLTAPDAAAARWDRQLVRLRCFLPTDQHRSESGFAKE